MNCSHLLLTNLQNVRHPEDAERIKLHDQLDIQKLDIEWEDEGGQFVLEKLLPPRTLEDF